eukprot:gene1151-1443_t
MSHGFKLRFDQMREGNPAKPESEQEPVPGGSDDTTHPVGHARNLCLVWPDGKRAFYNYAYLISAELDMSGEVNQIRLAFSSQAVLLKGYSLEALFMQLFDHLPRIITAIDPRYIKTESTESIVVAIQIEVDE